MTSTDEARAFLRTGDDYKESLRDGREVWYGGERIADVTAHPLTAAAIAWNARIYDAQHAQHAPETRDVLTYLRPDGARAATSWLVPRTPEDLARKRAEAELRFWESFGGMLARQPSHAPWQLMGYLGHLSVLREHCPRHADNLPRYLEYAEQRNLHLALVITEPQGARSRARSAGEDRSAVLRVVRRSAEGIWISGARAVGTGAAQANELVVGSVGAGFRPEESFWCAIPMSSPGLRLVCREGVGFATRPEDHPLAAVGEEVDTLALFDEVFVPEERVWALDAPALCAGALFGSAAAGEHWTHLVRMAVKAELFAGLAQLVVDALDTGGVPSVRDQVAQILEFAGVVRAGVVAAEHLARPHDGGVLLPDRNTVAALRSYSVGAYPQIIHILQELCGQGIVMRFSRSDFEHPEIGPELSRYLDGARVSARERSALLALVWDLTASALAGRTHIFENLQAYPPSMLRQILYDVIDRRPAMDRIRALLARG